MIAAILLGLAKANLAAGAAVLLVLAVRKPVRARFGARAAYVLWLAPLAAAAAVLAPHPQIVPALAPMLFSPILGAETDVIELVGEAPAVAGLSGPDPLALLFAVWLAGVAVGVGLALWRQGRFVAQMGRLTPGGAPRLFRAESDKAGPAVIGVLRPRIIAPADFETRFGEAERTLILAHEGVHLAGGDAAVNALACALQCLSWFNPLAHLGVRAMRIDQELACDASVIGRFPDARRAYAELLLKTQIATQPLPLGCHWPAGAQHPLKERIAMLKSPPPALALRATGLAAAGLLTLSAGGLAWAASPAAPAVVAAVAPAAASLAAPLPEAAPEGRPVRTAGGAAPAIGPAERRAAQAASALHPSYSCDPALEARGVGCKIVRVQNWLALPTRADLLRHYPVAARRAGLSAEVRITCQLAMDGLLQACAPMDTEVKAPDGDVVTDATRAAFGAAAVAVSRYYQWRIPASLPAGPAKMGHATLRIAFNPDGAMDFGPPPPGAVPARPMPALPASGAPAQPLLAAFSTGLAAATPAIVKPDWIEKPAGADFMRFYPPEALKGNFEGMTTLSCGVDREGRLTGCTASGPAGFGVPEPIREDFRKATLEMAALFRMRPQTVDGVAVGDGRINIPIRWTLPTDPAAKARLDALEH